MPAPSDIPARDGRPRAGDALPAHPMPAYAEAVLDLADLVPPGCATTYGDLAELLGTGGPRQPAAVLARFGSATAWWRVVRADGSLPDHLATEALARWRAEGTATRQTARGVVVDLRRARWTGPDADDPAARPTGGAGEGLSVPGGGI